MPDSAPPGSRLATTIKKRWRGWLRAVHRDFGYLAVGFTIIYALSGLAINHISEWDPNFTSSERTINVAPIGAEVPDDEALRRVLAATGTGTPDDVYRAGDEIRLTYSSGTHVTMIGDSGQITVQAREPRFFLRVANWLHYNRGKAAWTYAADVFAVMLLYLALSGIFMIKGRLGLKWRGAILISLGVAVPLGYVVLSGGPSKATRTAASERVRVAAPPEATPSSVTPSAVTPSATTPSATTPSPATLPPSAAPPINEPKPSDDDGFAMKPRTPPRADDAPAPADDGFAMKPRNPPPVIPATPPAP